MYLFLVLYSFCSFCYAVDSNELPDNQKLNNPVQSLLKEEEPTKEKNNNDPSIPSKEDFLNKKEKITIPPNIVTYAEYDWTKHSVPIIAPSLNKSSS